MWGCKWYTSCTDAPANGSAGTHTLGGSAYLGACTLVDKNALAHQASLHGEGCAIQVNRGGQNKGTEYVLQSINSWQ